MNAKSQSQRQRRAASDIVRIEFTLNPHKPREAAILDGLADLGRGEVAATIKDVLYSALAPRTRRRDGLTADRIREILREELASTKPSPASGRHEDDPDERSGGGGLSPSGGLDMTRPRRTGPPKVVHMPVTARIPEPALSPEDSARLLISSIKAFGRPHQPSP